MNLYFARHGQTDSNAGARATRNNAVNDEPLNKLGIQQANELAEELKNKKIDIIVSSPLRRAIQTAEIVNKHHDATISVDDAWQEIQIGRYVDIDTWNNLFDFDKNDSVKSAESPKDFFKRIYDALDALVAAHGDKTVLIVSHGGVQHAIRAYASKSPLAGNMRVSPMDNCEYRVYELAD